ncbi:MAG: AI-2E family transporter [Rhizomicrobium sp.]
MTSTVHGAPEASKSAPGASGLQEAASAAVVAAVLVAAVYFGRPLLVPLALSILLAFALAPVAEFLRRLKLVRIGAVILTVTLAVLLISGIAAFIGTQLAWLAQSLPQYQQNIVAKIQSVEGSATNNGMIQGALNMFNNLSDQIANVPRPGKNDQLESKTTSQRTDPAIPVVIRTPAPRPIEVIQNVGGPLLEPLANLAIIIIFVIFILLQKEDLRDRFIMLAGARDLQRTTTALDDGAERLSRYLLLQTAVNAVFGTLVGLGLWAVGVPNPALWGLIAAMFRFVPYVGVPIAALLPLVLAFAVDPGWSKLLWTLAVFSVLEAVTGQAVEPWLYGRNMGLSAIAVVVAAGFWTFVWGPVGLLLSTPLTMCLVVIGRHVDQLRFLDVMLGDRPPMAPEESFYLRMLAGNPDEAAEQAELYLQDHTMPAYFDQVAIKGLALAQLDVNRGALNESGRVRIGATVEGFIENLTMHEDAQLREESLLQDAVPQNWQNRPVLCVAGRGVLDHAAASLLAHLLERQGLGTRLATSEDLSPTNVQDFDCEGVQAICISYLEPGSPKNARYMARRLRKRMPGLPLIAGFWSVVQDDTHFLDSFESTECDFLATNLQQAVSQVIALMKRSGTEERFLSTVTQNEEEPVSD